ncbi:DMT family transporter [Methylophilus sp. 'Pure River']|uniref:DMT family transporter n=1 Tax=Methylophilus sp. 'Pure River' TaxID=3377117 RepID=UPI00398E66AC
MLIKIHPDAIYAILAAILFGLATPIAKLLVSDVSPQMLAGLLYAGSGLGLFILYGITRLFKRSHQEQNAIQLSDLPWLAGAIISGGMLGPALLMQGLLSTPASMASLLLNLESVLTAAFAWFIFKEHFDKRIFIGMVCIVLGSLLLSWPKQLNAAFPWGALAIAGACACWAIDNNLTRKISANDALQIACIKGLAAGFVNLVIALSLGNKFPGLPIGISAATIGFMGYGVSLVLFVISLRHIGTARTGAYFSVAPFAGVICSFVLLHEQPDALFWVATGCMMIGVWLHLTEHHAHAHHHEALLHKHIHTHDEHHQHIHDFDWDGIEPHVHPHQHTTLSHSHPHFPDIHHQHKH